MPDDACPEGIISRDEIAALVPLFDAAEFPLEPESVEAREALLTWRAATTALYERVRHHPDFQSIDQRLFTIHLRYLCRQMLKNRHTQF